MDYVCPSEPNYGSMLLELIRVGSRSKPLGIRLDSIGYSREEYCQFTRCIQLHRLSGMPWLEWRATQITEFVRQASMANGGGLSLALEADPCSAKERFGVDFGELSRHANCLVLPLYMQYSSVYWVDILPNSIRSRINKPMYVDL